MEDQPEPDAPSPAKPSLGTSGGRGKFQDAPGRSDRKSSEVFGGTPTSTPYLPGAGAAFGSNSVLEGEEDNEPTPLQRIEPPWAALVVTPKPSPQARIPSPLLPNWKAPSKPEPKPEPELETKASLPWEINLDIPEYKPKR